MDTIIIEKLKKVLEKILEENKDIIFFALIRKPDMSTWDLVISGKNLNETAEDVTPIVKLINKTFDKNEITIFSRLVILNSESLFIKNIIKSFHIGDRSVLRIVNSKINNILIEEAYLFGVEVV